MYVPKFNDNKKWAIFTIRGIIEVQVQVQNLTCHITENIINK